MGIESYSTSSGTDQPYFPENMPYSLVNDRARQLMADIRAWYNDSIWVEYGKGSLTPSVLYLNSTQFRVPSADATGFWLVGKAVRASGTLTGTIYGIISASVFQGGNTDITVTWASGALSAEAIRVWGSAIHPRSVPAGTITSTVIDSTAFATTTSGGEAAAGTSTTKLMSPLGTAVYVTGRLATSQEAIDGVSSTKLMSPDATQDFWVARNASNAEAEAGTEDEKWVSPAQVKLEIEAFVKVRSLFTSSEITVPSDGANTATAHGLGDYPRWMSCWLVCKTADRNWAVGDRIEAGDTMAVGGTGRGLMPYATSSTVGCVNAGTVSIPDKSTGVPGTITAASWRIIFEAGR